MGFLALMQIFARNFEVAVFLIGGSVIMDGFDGTVARLTKTESNFGVQLDSLVDAVSFGLVPAVMIYMFGFEKAGIPLGKVIGFVYLTAGVVRLARFNVLKEANAVPSNIFVGMPIPLGALSISSIVLMIQTPLSNNRDIILFSIYVVTIAFLMISTIKYRTMKKVKSKYNLPILVALALIVALAILYPRYTIPVLSLIYIVSPLFFFIYGKFNKNFSQIPPAAPPVENTPNKGEES